METSQPLFRNRQLFSLLWPLIVEQLLNVLVGMVDVVMVASLGEAAVSGVSLVDALNQLVIQFLAALTAGGTVVCAQYIGMRNMRDANRSAGQLLLIAICASLAVAGAFLLGGLHLLTLIFGRVEPAVMDNAYVYFRITTLSFPFLALYNAGAALFRAMGNSKVSMRVSLLMNGLNICGNALCLYGLHMGVAGVALPTLVSRMVAAGVITWSLQRRDDGIRLARLADLRPQPAIIRRILYIGIPGGLENSIFQLGKVMLQSLISTLGTPSIAGFAVASNLVTFLYLPGNALGLGLTTVVGRCVGAGEAEQARAYTRKLLILNYLLLLVLAPTLALGRGFFIGLYSLSGESARIAAQLVLAHCVAMLIWPLAFLLPNALRAANDVKFTTAASVFSMWTFRVFLAHLFIRTFHQGVLFAWYAMFVDWIFRTVVFLWRFRGYEGRVRALRLADARA